MDILDIEFILYLLPDMVEDIFPLIVGAVVEIGLEVDRLGFTFSQVNLLDTAASAQEQVLTVLVGNHRAVAHILEHDLGLVLAQVVLPQVHTALEGRLIVQGVAAIGQHGISQA